MYTEAQEVEDDRAHARVAQFEQRGVLRASGLVEERVEQQLAVLHASARQPFDLAVELGADALDELLVADLRLVGAPCERGAHLVAPGEVRGRLLAQVRGQRETPLLHGRVHGRAQRRVIEVRRANLAERLGDVRRKRGREERDLGLAEAVVPGKALDDLLHLRAERVGREGGDCRVSARREVARARLGVVVVDALVLDGHVRHLDCPVDFLGALRTARHAPVLAARAQGVADLRGVRVEEADLPLRDERLQRLVRLEGEVHARGVGADQHVVFREKQVRGVRKLRVLLRLREGRLSGGRAGVVEGADPGHALHRVDAALRHETGRAEENGADAALEGAVRVSGK